MEIMMIRKSEVNDIRQSGFTLIELMVALAIAAFLLGVTYATFISQQTSQVVQNQVGEMQQNIRAGMVTLTRDIREAGCDPTQKAVAGITTAAATQIQFTRDIAGHAVKANQEDGDVEDDNEVIAFVFDPVAETIIRTDVIGGDTRIIAQNIDQVEFSYLDKDGDSMVVPVGKQVDRNKIKAVQISVLAKAARQDPDFTNDATYTSATGATWSGGGDGFRRRLQVTTIQLRNKEYLP